MNIRFADKLFSEYADTSTIDRHDFAVRRRRPLWKTLVLMFLTVLLLIMYLSLFLKDILIFSQIIFFLLLCFGGYVVYIVQQSRDLVLATEFQNALFSSALSHSNKFCMIIKNDNSVAYIDQSMQEMFPNFLKQPRRGIDVLLELGNVSIEDRKVIFAALDKRARDKVIFDITDNKKQVHRIIMSIEPISRPKGFMLMRGHEFVEKRVLGPQVSAGNNLPFFNKANMGLFSYITDSMDIGAYISDLNGNITYANLTLEQWLDFEENEMIASSLSLKDIISQASLNYPVNELKKFSGELLLMRKIGGSFKVSLEQKAMYDEQGLLIGYAALVRPVQDAAPPSSHKIGNDTW